MGLQSLLFRAKRSAAENGAAGEDGTRVLARRSPESFRGRRTMSRNHVDEPPRFRWPTSSGRDRSVSGGGSFSNAADVFNRQPYGQRHRNAIHPARSESLYEHSNQPSLQTGDSRYAVRFPNARSTIGSRV